MLMLVVGFISRQYSGLQLTIRYVPWCEGSGWDGSLFTEADEVGSGIINFYSVALFGSYQTKALY
jgi:hypothetical protein